MAKLSKMNGDVLLEITRYLSNYEKLSLAYTFREALHLSGKSTYWHPNSFTDTDIIHPTFLPLRIASWSGYTGDEYRTALQRMYASQNNWLSENPRANSFRRLEKPTCGLMAIPGSRWILSSGPIAEICFADLKTGGFVSRAIDPRGGFGWQWGSPRVYSCSPNELWLGMKSFGDYSGYVDFIASPHGHKQALSWDSLDIPNIRHEILRVVFTEDPSNEGKLHFDITPLFSFTWYLDVIWVIRSSFSALCKSSENEEHSVGLIEHTTGQNWTWTTANLIAALELFDDWLIILTRSETLELVVMNISAVILQHPGSQGSAYNFPLPIGVKIFQHVLCKELQEIVLHRCVINVFPAPPEDRGKNEEDTFVILVNQSDKFWPVRFHLTKGDGTAALVKICQGKRGCQSSTCRHYKGLMNGDESPNIIIPHTSNSRTRWYPHSFGLQLVNFIQVKRNAVLINQIAGVDGPEDFHTLDLTVGGGPVARKDNRNAKKYVSIRYIDGATGILLVSTDERSVGAKDCAVYWF